MTRSSLKDSIIAAIICLVFVLFFAIVDENIRHWFIFPVFVCGVLIGKDGVAWIRGHLDLFDPVGTLGLLGWHFFFLTPLLHVHWNEWGRYMQFLSDWRPWLGYMAMLNIVGLVSYQFFLNVRISNHYAKQCSQLRIIDNRRLGMFLSILLPLTFVLQMVVYFRTGGISGYVNVVSAASDAFRGMGWLFMLSGSFPILVVIGYICWIKHRLVQPKWITLVILLFCFFLLQLLFGGLRGSRSTTIWKLVWVVGMIHLAVRPFSRKELFLGAIFLFLFMYIYGFYKEVGRDAIYFLKGGISFAEQKTKRTFSGMLLGDLGRSDVQACLFRNSIEYASQNDFSYGRTYIGALSLLIPQKLWPNRPPTKVKEGTDALYGRGAWDSGITASNVYGLGGEAMLNFGFFGVPFAYAVLGLVVARIQKCLYSLSREDGRILLVPFWVLFCVIMLIGDSDNLIFFAISDGLLPTLLVRGSLKNCVLNTP